MARGDNDRAARDAGRLFSRGAGDDFRVPIRFIPPRFFAQGVDADRVEGQDRSGQDIADQFADRLLQLGFRLPA